jgi:hypothetical protein
MVKLEQAIQSTKFKNEMHKASLNILYTAWWLKTQMSKVLKEFGLTHEQYNVLRILKGKYPEQLCVKDISCRMIEKSSNCSIFNHLSLANNSRKPPVMNKEISVRVVLAHVELIVVPVTTGLPTGKEYVPLPFLLICCSLYTLQC